MFYSAGRLPWDLRRDSFDAGLVLTAIGSILELMAVTHFAFYSLSVQSRMISSLREWYELRGGRVSVEAGRFLPGFPLQVSLPSFLPLHLFLYSFSPSPSLFLYSSFDSTF